MHVYLRAPGTRSSVMSMIALMRLSPTPEGKYCILSAVTIPMDCRHQKANLSFSIENILRDDFPCRQEASSVNPPTRGSSSASCSNNAVYHYYAVHYYRPVVVKCLPNIHRVDGRFRLVNEEEEQKILTQKPTIEDFSGCKDESLLQHKKGKS